MTKEYADKLVDLGIDSVFVSIDAMTKGTLKKVRGTEELDKVKGAVFFILNARGDKPLPRVGVSFVTEEANMHEKGEFISYWIKHADAVRVSELYLKAKKLVPKDRKPCTFLYNNFFIHNNGDVPICCLDGNGKTNMGNVFESGIRGVWLGEKFQQARHYHETGQFDKISFCKGCPDWIRNDLSIEEIKSDILIRRSPLLTYYNRIDRLDTWRFGDGEKIMAAGAK
jgi:MoaA/NifB/PqqE/SkfB family radical SAM enzyme